MKTTMNANRFGNYLVAIVLVGVPFHAFLTVWGSTLVGHYTLLRLWDDIVLLAALILLAVRVVRDPATRRRLTGDRLWWLVGAYLVLNLLLGVIAYLKGEVTAKALGYGWLSDLRYLLWFAAVMALASRSAWLQRRWARLLLWPAAIVTAFAVLQYTVLPHDFLAHFGYNAHTTIAPMETINHNSHYIRVASTTRGANPLGAYLIVVLAALAASWYRVRRYRWRFVLLSAVSLFALYATGSRSAWIGTLLAMATVVATMVRSRRGRQLFGAGLLALVLIAGAVYTAERHNTGLQNELLHTQQHSAVSTSSNQAHASALRRGMQAVVHQPYGAGPGTAGTASVYNGTHGARIAENYYVQVAQETGWLGLALFAAILFVVGRRLWCSAANSRLALVLFASLIGLSFVNLLSHGWADDTVAFVWWGLAGIALAYPGQETAQREI